MRTDRILNWSVMALVTLLVFCTFLLVIRDHMA